MWLMKVEELAEMCEKKNRWYVTSQLQTVTILITAIPYLMCHHVSPSLFILYQSLSFAHTGLCLMFEVVSVDKSTS